MKPQRVVESKLIPAAKHDMKSNVATRNFSGDLCVLATVRAFIWGGAANKGKKNNGQTP